MNVEGNVNLENSIHCNLVSLFFHLQTFHNRKLGFEIKKYASDRKNNPTKHPWQKA